MFRIATNGIHLAQKPSRHGDLIHHALTLPNAALRYHIAEELALLFPDRALLESDDCDFNLWGYGEAGLCQLTPDPALYSQFVVAWSVHPPKIVRSARNAWLRVEWQGHALDALLIYDSDACGTVAWLLAETVEVAEAFFAAVCSWNSEVREEVLVFERDFWRKSDELYAAIQGATRDELVLPEAIEAPLFEDVARFFGARETYGRYGVPWKRGIILIGPPGNGKTHAVKALVNATGLPCLYVKSIAAERGSEHRNIRAIFDKARALAPCVLVLEDLDALVTGENRAFFLNELDGFAGNNGILTLATTNYPEKLDPSIMERPSRFDRKYHFGLPEAPERRRYLARWNERLDAALRLSAPGLDRAALLTEGFSFAYLKELMLAATMAWIAAPAPGTMDEVVAAQAAALRAQMASAPAPVAEVDLE